MGATICTEQNIIEKACDCQLTIWCQGCFVATMKLRDQQCMLKIRKPREFNRRRSVALCRNGCRHQISGWPCHCRYIYALPLKVSDNGHDALVSRRLGSHVAFRLKTCCSVCKCLQQCGTRCCMLPLAFAKQVSCYAQKFCHRLHHVRPARRRPHVIRMMANLHRGTVPTSL